MGISPIYRVPPLRKNLVRGGRGISGPQAPPLVWLLYDEFTTAESAPLTSPRTCEPGPGTLTIVDTGNVASISDGDALYTLATGAGDPHYFGAFTNASRLAGLCGHIKFKKTANSRTYFGLHTDYADSPTLCSTIVWDTYIRIRDGGTILTGDVYGIENNIYYNMVVVNRSVGNFYIMNGTIIWVGTFDTAVHDNIMFNSTGTNAGVLHSDNFGALSLPANNYTAWDADFSTVTESITGSSSGTLIDCENNHHITSLLLHEAGKYCYIYSRFTSSQDTYYMGITAANAAILRRYVGGVSTVLYTGGAYADATTYKFDLVAEDTSLKFFIDNVLIYESTTAGTVPNNPSAPTNCAKAVHNHTANDIDFTTHPYPALGIATDRVIAPQASDTATHTADCLIYGRGVTLPSADSLQYETRKSGSDEITLDIDSAGKPIVKENGVARITGINGDVTDGDDWGEILDDTDVSLFIEGTQIGATYSSLSLTGGTTFNMASIGTGGATDSVECFQRDVSDLLPKELV